MRLDALRPEEYWSWPESTRVQFDLRARHLALHHGLVSVPMIPQTPSLDRSTLESGPLLRGRDNVRAPPPVSRLPAATRRRYREFVDSFSN